VLVRLGLIGLALALFGLCGCSRIINTCGRPFEYSVAESFFDDVLTTLLREDDLLKAEASIPTLLTVMDTLLLRHPKQERLLELSAMGYSYYALTMLHLKAMDPTLSASRKEQYLATARVNYLKSRDYGLRLLNQHHPNFEKTLFASHPLELTKFLQKLGAKDVVALNWMTMSWLLYINISRHDSYTLTQIGSVRLLAQRLYQLDSDYFYGLPTLFMGAINATLPKIAGYGQESIDYFGQARAKHQDRFLLAKLLEVMFSYMETEPDNERLENRYRKAQKLLQEIIAAPNDLLPEMRLTNEVAKLWAHYLLYEADEFLAEADYTIRACTIVFKGTIWHKSLADIGARIAEQSGGKVKLRIIATNYDDAEDEVVLRLKSGQCDVASLLTPSFVTATAPSISLFEMPYYYKDDNILRCIVNELIDVIDLQYEAKGVTFLNVVPIGSLRLYSTRPFKNFEEVKGWKMWSVSGHKFSEKVVQKCHLVPVFAPLKNVREKIIRGEIDIVYGTAIEMATLGWFSNLAYITSPEDIIGRTFGASLIRNDVWLKLPENYQHIVRQNFMAAIQKDFFDLVARENEKGYRAMTEFANLKILAFPPTDRQIIYKIGQESIQDLMQEKLISKEVYQRFKEIELFCKVTADADKAKKSE
jgi:TRAP-type C4-dicarboxylate transport system substrate-binding protein